MKTLYTYIIFLLFLFIGNLSLAQTQVNVVAVYPNPIEDVVTLKFSPESAEGIYEWQVLDYQGRVFKSGSFFRVAHNDLESLSLYDVSPGVYILLLRKEGKEDIIRIIKN